MEKFIIDEEKEFINLSQFLKANNLISSGGEVGFFLKNNQIKLNDIIVFEKRKKIYPNDVLEINDEKYLFTKNS